MHKKMKMLNLTMSALLLTARLWAADSSKGPAPAKVDQPGRAIDLARLTLTAEAEKRLGIVTIPAVRKKLERSRRFGGELILPVQRLDSEKNAAALPFAAATSFNSTELMRVAQL